MSLQIISDQQAKYFAHLLTRKTASCDSEELMRVILDAKVEPKPHQIDAVLFAFHSPFSNIKRFGHLQL